MIHIQNKGYVRRVDVLGSDLTIVNSARVSFNKAVTTLEKDDQKLIDYLAKHDHTSPFRHAVLQFELYAPLMVARQWWKYIIGSNHQEALNAWNESSRRYVTEEIEFYIPKEDAWRAKPENQKQGSGAPVDTAIGKQAVEKLMRQIDDGMAHYHWAIEQGIATEQARLFIPSAYGLMVRWYWTASLQGVCHFINQRTDAHAQYEIQEYAQAIKKLTLESFPYAANALMK